MVKFNAHRARKQEEAKARYAKTNQSNTGSRVSQGNRTLDHVDTSRQDSVRTLFVLKRYANNSSLDFDPNAATIKRHNTHEEHAIDLSGAAHYDFSDLYNEVVRGRPPFDAESVLNLISKDGKQGSKLPFVHCDLDNNEWIKWPDTIGRRNETELCDYLNSVADSVRGVLKIPRTGEDLVFASPFNLGSGLKTGRTTVRKPDVVVIPRYLEEAKVAKWCDVRCVGSLMTDIQTQEIDSDQIKEYARFSFAEQPNRSYILGLEFIHNTVSLCVFDRSGILATPHINIVEDPLAFLHYAISILFLDDARLGYDTSISTGDKTIKVKDSLYEILEYLYAEQTLRGRGTVCFKVQDEDNKVYVVKDTWIDRTKSAKEIEILQELNTLEIENVPTLIAHEIVPLSGDPSKHNCTENLRMHKILEEIEHKDRTAAFALFRGGELRDHYRILQEPYGEPFYDFDSLPELLSATHDILDGIEALDKLGFVHRDISINNVILVHTSSSRYRKGYIIDFDNAMKMDDKREAAVAKRTGTLEFMAVDILKLRSKHTAIHDAESTFYILIWLCCLQEGPHFRQRVNFDAGKTFLGQWTLGDDIDGDKMNIVGIMKENVMNAPDQFKAEVLMAIHPYFKPLKKCLLFMRQTLFPRQKGYDLDFEKDFTLSDDESPSPKSENVETDHLVSQVLQDLKKVVYSYRQMLEEKEEARAKAKNGKSLVAAMNGRSQTSTNAERPSQVQDTSINNSTLHSLGKRSIEVFGPDPEARKKVKVTYGDRKKRSIKKGSV